VYNFRKRLACSTVGFLLIFSAFAMPVADEAQAEQRAIAVTRQYRLSADQSECLKFDGFDSGEFWTIRVREIHTLACGGPPDVSPTLFWLRIRKSDGSASIDNDDGTYRPLTIEKRKRH
jgi:hypothetical protein